MLEKSNLLDLCRELCRKCTGESNLLDFSNILDLSNMLEKSNILEKSNLLDENLITFFQTLDSLSSVAAIKKNANTKAAVIDSITSPANA